MKNKYILEKKIFMDCAGARYGCPLSNWFFYSECRTLRDPKPFVPYGWGVGLRGGRSARTGRKESVIISEPKRPELL